MYCTVLFRLEARLAAVEAQLAGEKRKNSAAGREAVTGEATGEDREEPAAKRRKATGEAAGGDLEVPAAKRRKATAPVSAAIGRGREASRPQRSAAVAAVAAVVWGESRGRGRQVVAQELPVGRDISPREGEVEEEGHRCSLRCPVSCQVTPTAPSSP